MKLSTKHSILLILCLGVFTTAGIFLAKKGTERKLVTVGMDDEDEMEEHEEAEAIYVKERAQYDFDMIKDPVTGTLPRNVFMQETEFARSIPLRRTHSGPGSRPLVLNNYFPAGPNNVGGRTRALAYDKRYDGTSNRVILAGCVSGGIMRSADGGATWTRVSPENRFHSITVLKQDPRAGFEDNWYAGTGEPYGNTASDNGAFYVGNGFWVSNDNGLTWAQLTPQSGNNPTQFDNIFDIIYNIAVSPVNGDVYLAVLGNLLRLKFSGTTVTSTELVFEGAFSGSTSDFQTDVISSPTGKIYFAMNGGSTAATKRGIWKSNNGDSATYSRIAGGSALGVDSVAGWRGNDYSGNGKRILMTLAPSDEKIMYVTYENGLSNVAPDFKPEVDLFKLDMTSGNTWTNLSANVPDFPGGNQSATDPFTSQGGYDLILAVKPDDPNFVLLGGSSLYRSTNGFSTPANAQTNWIGGYANTSATGTLGLNPNCHPDIHNIAFNPTNANEVICATDGGLHKTIDIRTNVTPANPVTWQNIPNYQTLQYYHGVIMPQDGSNNFLGGAQDNGSFYRDKIQLLGSTPASDSNNHIRVNGGDGGYVGMTSLIGNAQYLYVTFQFGSVRRLELSASPKNDDIRPSGGLLTPASAGSTTEYGEFTTNIRLDPDNTQDLYYVNFNRLFRTTSAATVTATGWTELTGVSSAANPTNNTSVGIRAMAFTRGPYTTSHALFLGTTNGKLLRLDDPRNAAANKAPVNITPSVVASQGLNIQDIAVNPNNDNEVILVTSNYARTVGSNFQNVVNIWWTNNAKAATPTWVNAEGNLAGTTSTGFISGRSCLITVKKDASNNPVTEYYVGTAAGLYSVENLGTTLQASGTPSWQREGGNVLNLAVIVALSYRPTDNTILVTTHGNGLYYTTIGTPNFTPNQNTGINDPVLNDKNFINQVRPTYSDRLVEYRIGNMFTVQKISVQVFNLTGQQLFRKETGYENGTLDISTYPKGMYVLSITSDDGKYRHLQKIIKQ